MENKRGIYDVVVVGGGFAGAAAAVAAARQGSRTLLIEQYNCPGGAAAFDLINPFMRYWTLTTGEDGRKRKDKFLSRGIFEEIVNGMTELGGMAPGSLTCFNEEYLKLVLNRMLTGAGVQLLFNTVVTGVSRSGGKIEELEIFSVSGKDTVRGRVYVDATGDANLSFLAGFPYRVGRESDGLCQPMTLCFRLAGVDMEAYRREKPQINPLYEQYQAEGKITNPRENVLIFNTVMPGILHFNTTRVVKLDPTDVDDVTRAELIAREQVFEMVDFLRANFSAFRSCQLISSGLRIGARESRMIVGLHTLNKEEMVACTKFPDGIAACNYDIDIHSPDGAGTSHYYFPDRAYYTIPYGCLVPAGAENLLAAGRCISTTHEAQASVRIMPTCCNLGEAAGIAAHLAAASGRGVDELDTEEVRALLRTVGAVVD